MAHRKSDAALGDLMPPVNEVEHFAVPSQMLRQSQTLRLDASYFNPQVARALETLRHSGMTLAPLGEIVSRVFIPNRFKRIYVAPEHGLPFLQGSHIVHFQPADIKYVSRRAHRNIEQWTIEQGWLLVTRSGTVGRVALCPPEWDGWAASEHILRIVPNEDECPSGYLYSFLMSPLGHVQLTAQIYGAVVDELTEDQTKSVLVPLPVTDEQRELVAAINREARDAVATRSRAVGLLTVAVDDMAALVRADRHDAAIATQRLAELNDDPKRVIRGKALGKRLEALL